jgi:hypothetical protein
MSKEYGINRSLIGLIYVISYVESIEIVEILIHRKMLRSFIGELL